jgi:hypothetical protein
MAGVEAYRRLVVARAGGACEYCRLLQDAAGVTFHVEHIRPRSLGGQTDLSNLALGCPGCNLAKGTRIAGVDAGGATQQLFIPRSYDPWILGWHLHFTLDRRSGRVLARTPVGEATISTLKMNDPARTFARKLQIDAGLIG